MFHPPRCLRRCAPQPKERGAIPTAAAAFQMEAKGKTACVPISQSRRLLHTTGGQNLSSALHYGALIATVGMQTMFLFEDIRFTLPPSILHLARLKNTVPVALKNSLVPNELQPPAHGWWPHCLRQAKTSHAWFCAYSSYIFFCEWQPSPLFFSISATERPYFFWAPIQRPILSASVVLQLSAENIAHKVKANINIIKPAL